MTEASVRDFVTLIDLWGGKLLPGSSEVGLWSGLDCLEAPIRNPAGLDKQKHFNWSKLYSTSTQPLDI